jgi:oligopeptide transport system permease protein
MDITSTQNGPALEDRPLSAEERRQLKEQSLSPAQAAVRRFLRDRRAVVCLGIILFVVVVSFVFPAFYEHIGPTILGGVSGTTLEGPQTYHMPAWNELSRSDGPSTLFPLGANSLAYPLGTDTLGRDIFARLMGGVKTSVTIALLVEVFDIGLGVLFGVLAGFYAGWIDTALARFTDIAFAFPGLLLILLIGAALGPTFDDRFGSGLGRPLLLILTIGILVWPLMMRFVRGQTLALKEQQFVEAARTVGTRDRRIITRHIIPNLMNIVVVASTLNILGTITTEAGISLLGVGIQPPAVSLGLMLSDAVNTIYTSATELLWPVFTLVILIVCIAFVGDGVRDAFDPRTKD